MWVLSFQDAACCIQSRKIADLCDIVLAVVLAEREAARNVVATLPCHPRARLVEDDGGPRGRET